MQDFVEISQFVIRFPQILAKFVFSQKASRIGSI